MYIYLGCTQRKCEINKDIVDNYRTMFESRISAGGLKKLPFSQNTRIFSWSYDMVGHAKKCVERYCELANKTTQQLYKVSTPCIDDHHFKEEETKSIGELSSTAIVSFRTLPVGFPLPTISKNSLYTLFCSLILDHGVLLKISISAPKILISNFLLDTSFHQSFQICDNQVLTSSDESPGHTIPIRS